MAYLAVSQRRAPAIRRPGRALGHQPADRSGPLLAHYDTLRFDPDQAAEELITLATGAGAPDNVTCIVADIAAVPAGSAPD